MRLASAHLGVSALTPMTPDPVRAPEAGGGPLAAGTEQLQLMLSDRFVQSGHAGSPGVPAPLVVALGDTDVLRPDLDRAAGSRGAATVHLTSDSVLVGPWGGGEDPQRGCGHCLAIRWQRLRERYERDVLETGTGLRAAGQGSLITDYLADAVWSAYEGAFVAYSRRPGGLSGVTWIDSATLGVRTVSLLAEPRCPSCAEGELDTAESAVLQLTARRKPDGTSYRLRGPGDYRLPVDALANPVCGVLGVRTNVDLVCPTTAPVSGGATTRVATDGLVDISWSGHTTSYAGSRNVALLEGLERYAGTARRRNADFVVDSYANLRGQALDPRECGVYRPEVYENDARLAPFSEDRRIAWVWGYSLRDERPLLLPARSVHYGDTTAAENFVYESSNGCAGGSCLEEAALFGLLELVERDAFLLGWYGGASLTEIDLAGWEDVPTRALLDRAWLHGYDVRVFDNRIDLPIPVVTAVATKREGGAGLFCFAAGASLAPELAIRAAISEVVSFVPTLARRVRERWDELDAMTEDFTKVRVLADHTVLFGMPRMARHASRYLKPKTKLPFAEVYRDWQEGRPSSSTLLDDVAFCRDQLVAAGHDVIVVDQTSSEQRSMGLASVATVVPGLVPLDFGWEKQRALHLPRMFSAFRRAGWRTTDLLESELHRVPHPFP